MALQTKTISSSSVNNYTLKLILTENGTSLADNTSSVSWRLQLVTSYYGFSDFRLGWSVSLAGRVVSSQIWSSNESYSSIANNNGTLTIASGTSNVAHNADGSLNMACAASFFMDPSRTDSYLPTRANATTGERSPAVSGSMALTTIPRASTLTASGGTLGTQQTLTVNRASTGFTHTLTYACGSLTGQTSGLGAITGSGTTQTVAFTPPLSLARQNTTGQSVSVTFTLTTWNGSTKVGSTTRTVSMAIPASVKPSCSAAVEVVNDNATVAGWGVAVKGYSKYKVTTTFSNTNSQGSTFKSRSVKISATGQTLTTSPATSKVLASTSRTVKVQVVDSRDRPSTEISVTGPVIYDYGNPTISEATAYRCTGGGVRDDEGAYLYVKCTGDVFSCGDHNGKTVQYRYRATGGSWTSWASLTSGTAQTVNAGLSAASSYEVVFRVTDSLGGARSVTVTIPTATVTMNLRAGGSGVAFGGYAQRDSAVDFTTWDVLGRVAGLGYCAQIPQNADLDGYTAAGVYGVNGTDVAATLLHCPSGSGGGRLTVVNALGLRHPPGVTGSVYLRQIYETRFGLVYQRSGSGSSGLGSVTWSDWDLVWGVDAVAAQGTSGGWSYRKWVSGTCELWANVSVTPTSSTASGTGYRSEQLTLSLPFAVKNTVVTGTGNNLYMIASTSVNAAAAASITLFLWRSTAIAAGTAVTLHLRVDGEWA